MKLLLAGMENKSNRALAKRFGVKSILVSAYYLRNSPDMLRQIMQDFEFVFLDSGAFTFNGNLARFQDEKLPANASETQKRAFFEHPESVAFFEAQAKERAAWSDQYLAMVKGLGDNPHVTYVEFDSGDYHEIWLRRHKWLREGTKPLLVWHAGQHRDLFTQLCAHSPYVGLGGLALGSSKFRAQQFSWAVSTAKEFGCKIHGFGMTQQEPMRRVPMFTVDSTSWLSGARYGVHYEYRAGRLRVWDKNYKKERKRLRRKVEELGIDPKGFEGDDSDALNTWNLAQWAQLARDLETAAWKRQQEYWHSPSFAHKRMRYYSLSYDAPGRFRAMDEQEYLLYTTGEIVPDAEGGYLPDEVACSPETPIDKDTLHIKQRYGKMSTVVDPKDEAPPKDEEEADDGADGGEEEEGAEADDGEPGEPSGGSEVAPVLYDKEQARKMVLHGGGVLECSKCALAERCFSYKLGALCSLLPDATITPANYLSIYDQLITIQYRRVVRVSHFEATEGGMVDSALQGEMRHLTNLMSGRTILQDRLDNMGNGQPKLPVDDGEEVEVTVKAKAGGGVLSGLLAGITGNSRRGQNQSARIAAEVEEIESAQTEPVLIPKP